MTRTGESLLDYFQVLVQEFETMRIEINAEDFFSNVIFCKAKWQPTKVVSSKKFFKSFVY